MTDDLRPASAEFKLSITRALADQLAESLGRLHPTPLTTDNLDRLQARPGVYELFLEEDRVYVGKASKDLPTRLRNHLRKLAGRAGIDPSDVTFLCLYVDEDLEAAAPETLLIKKYRKDGLVPWNTNGFGNKDPGRNRDKSLVKQRHFDTSYPIDLEKIVGSIEPGTYLLNDYLNLLKSALPYLLRFGADLPLFSSITLEVPAGATTARQHLQLAMEALPAGWQATALPGYAILYQEESEYKSALVIWRKENGLVREIAGAQQVTTLEAPEDSIEDSSN